MGVNNTNPNLICIFLTTSDSEHLLKCSLAIWIFLPLKGLFLLFAPLSVKLLIHPSSLNSSLLLSLHSHGH